MLSERCGDTCISLGVRQQHKIHGALWGTGAGRTCPTQAQLNPCKGTGLPSGADARAEVSAVGARDIWKRSFHSSENTATRLQHGEELTLTGLPERPAQSYC